MKKVINMSLNFVTHIHSIKHFYKSDTNEWCFKVIAEVNDTDVINVYKHKLNHSIPCPIHHEYSI